MRGLSPARVQAALRAHTLARATCMRATLYLLPARDLAVFVRGAAGRFERELRWVRGKGIPDREVEALIDAVLSALDQPLTRHKLSEAVSRSLGAPLRVARGAGWGHSAPVPALAIGGLTFPMVYVLHLAAAGGVLCLGPNRGNEPTFVRADAWVPGWRDVPREQAEGQLLRLYLRAFGPATPVDFALWAGMPQAQARAVWAREATGIDQVTVQGWQAAALTEDVGELARARLDGAPVRLLPYFDSYLLGHRARGHLVATQHYTKVYRAQGWIAPVVLVDGRAVAVWSHALKGNRLRLKVTKLVPLSRRVAADLWDEARDLGRFLGASDVEVQIA